VKELLQLFADIIRYTPPTEQFPTVFIQGSTGIGKTTVNRDLAAALNSLYEDHECTMTFCNLAGQEAPDIVGLPTEINGVVFFAEPWWFNHAEDMNDSKLLSRKSYLDKIKKIFKDIPKNRLPERVLNLDEVNRISPDSFAPAMNIILEGKHQNKRMKARTLIIAAGNMSLDTGDENYAVNEFDPAQRDRLLSVRLVPSLKEWKDWAGDTVHEGIIRWVEKNKDFVKAFNTTKGVVSLRRITKLGQTLNECPEEYIENQTRCRLLINAFIPNQLVEGVNLEVQNATGDLDAEKVIKEYPKHQKKVIKFVKQNKLDIIHQVCDRLIDCLLDNEKAKGKKQTSKEKVVKHISDFLLDVPRANAFKILNQLPPLIREHEHAQHLLSSMSKNQKIMELCKIAAKENVAKKEEEDS